LMSISSYRRSNVANRKSVDLWPVSSSSICWSVDCCDQVDGCWEFSLCTLSLQNVLIT